MLKQLIIASIAIAAVTATAAQAQVSDVPTVKISMAGLDTKSDSGAHIMLQRITFAAETVCGPLPSSMLDRQQKYAPCVREVTQRTVSELNIPRLTALLTNGNIAGPQSKLASAK